LTWQLWNQAEALTGGGVVSEKIMTTGTKWVYLDEALMRAMQGMIFAFNGASRLVCHRHGDFPKARVASVVGFGGTLASKVSLNFFRFVSIEL
jgi:hypothetical protein